MTRGENCGILEVIHENKGGGEGLVINVALALSMLGSVQEEDRFEELINQYQGLMFYVARKFTADIEEQKEIVQESLLALAKNFYKIIYIFSSVPATP